MTFAVKKNLLNDIFEEFASLTGGSFLDWVYDILFELEEDEIPSDELIEGSGEKQIDVLRVEEDTAGSTARVTILQTKKTGGFAGNTVVLISNGISTILETSKAEINKLKNQSLAGKVLEIREILKKYGYGSVEFHVYYATLGDKTDVGLETLAEIKKIKKKWAGTGVKAFNFELLGAAELYDLWWQKIQPNEISTRISRSSTT